MTTSNIGEQFNAFDICCKIFDVGFNDYKKKKLETNTDQKKNYLLIAKSIINRKTNICN